MPALSGRTRQVLLALAAVLVLLLLWWARTPDSADPTATEPAPTETTSQVGTDLPAEAHDVLALIRDGGPFPYDRDGITFQNREGLLPQRERGYYREYTVPTPGLDHRGARRIVTGGDPVEVAWYTADHYRSFTRIEGYP